MQFYAFPQAKWWLNKLSRGRNWWLMLFILMTDAIYTLVNMLWNILIRQHHERDIPYDRHRGLKPGHYMSSYTKRLPKKCLPGLPAFPSTFRARHTFASAHSPSFLSLLATARNCKRWGVFMKIFVIAEVFVNIEMIIIHRIVCCRLYFLVLLYFRIW